MTVKRSREDREVEAFAMANCLMLLSNMAKTTSSPPSLDRVFTCKTCNKQFSSFQALGGHRASHKRTRLVAADGLHDQNHSPAKPKTHECSICGLEFPLGQALGGHMRRHRNDGTAEETQSGSQKSNSRSDSHRALLLDLNLTPRENEFKFGRLDTFM
nr:zinc finger protein ZAT12-like [Coffea arabica]